jgi:hypothetical protein
MTFMSNSCARIRNAPKSAATVRRPGSNERTPRKAISSESESPVFIVETAATIWMVLLIAVAAATALFAIPRRPARTPEPEPVTDEHALAAERAAEASRCRRAEWLAAQEQVDATWAAFDAADRDARRVAAAAAFPIIKQRRTRAELADRERNLHRMATAACRHRELSIGQLNEVLAHRGTWNPRRHPVAQEAALRAAVREHRFAAYQAAAEHEREAWQEAERAAATLRSLRAEALPVRARAGRDVHYEQQWQPVRPAKARLAVH